MCIWIRIATPDTTPENFVAAEKNIDLSQFLMAGFHLALFYFQYLQRQS